MKKIIASLIVTMTLALYGCIEPLAGEDGIYLNNRLNVFIVAITIASCSATIFLLVQWWRGTRRDPFHIMTDAVELLDRAPAWVWTWGRAGDKKYICDGVRGGGIQIVGWQPGQAIGTNLMELAERIKEWNADLPEVYRDVTENGSTRHVFLTFPTASGSIHFADATFAPLSSGRCGAVARIVTDLGAKNERLKAKIERLRGDLKFLQTQNGHLRRSKEALRTLNGPGDEVGIDKEHTIEED